WPATRDGRPTQGGERCLQTTLSSGLAEQGTNAGARQEHHHRRVSQHQPFDELADLLWVEDLVHGGHAVRHTTQLPYERRRFVAHPSLEECNTSAFEHEF